MSNYSRVIGMLILTCIIASCNRNLFRATLDAESTLFEIQEFDFDYLKAKAKFRYDNGKDDLKATANIRIKKDSLIWMSISATLGIEAARIMIAKDSMVIIDRLNKQYTVLNYEDLTKKYNFKIDYSLLQAVLLGDLSNPIEKEDKISKEPSHFLVLQDRGDVKMENFIGLKNMKLERAKWLDKPTSNTLTINYTDFQLLNDYIFPYENQIILKYKSTGNISKNTQINIDYNKAEVSDKKEKFPFNIPQKYERK